MLPFDHDVVATCHRADAHRLADSRRLVDGHRGAGPIGIPATTDSLRAHVGALLVRAGHRLQATGPRTHVMGPTA